VGVNEKDTRDRDRDRDTRDTKDTKDKDNDRDLRDKDKERTFAIVHVVHRPFNLDHGQRARRIALGMQR
jgi:hypothetical protein